MFYVFLCLGDRKGLVSNEEDGQATGPMELKASCATILWRGGLIWGVLTNFRIPCVVEGEGIDFGSFLGEIS
jgi:hypothetical protein